MVLGVAARSTRRGDDGITRCFWGAEPPDNRHYHDTEWGLPEADDTRLFEKVCLEGFQSGLSWLTILRKRENFRSAFAGFDPERVARFNTRSVARLLRDAGIVRRPGKGRSRPSCSAPHLGNAESVAREASRTTTMC